MELREGKMTTREFADWMGVSYSYFSNKKDKLLEKLKDFADFVSVHGGVMVSNIRIPVYIKDLDEDTKVYFEEVRSRENGLASVSSICKRLARNDSYWAALNESSAKYRMTKAGKKAFGETSKPGSYGRYGTREYVWCIKLYDGSEGYRLMTKEEKALFDRLTAEVCKSPIEKIQELALQAEVYGEDDEISKEDYLEMVKNITSFSNVMWAFKQETGEQIVKATMHHIFKQYQEDMYDWAADIECLK